MGRLLLIANAIIILSSFHNRLTNLPEISKTVSEMAREMEKVTFILRCNARLEQRL